MVVRCFDVFLVNLDPNVGSEIQKTRPCLVISPDEMNKRIASVIIAPMTTKGQVDPSRIACHFQGKDGQIILDKIPTVDNNRLVQYLGKISADEQKAVLDNLAQMFAE